MIEIKQYEKAIEVLKASLKLNPIGISARFEICEAYLRLNKLAEARKTLLDMKQYLAEESSIAKFYRRLGFIEIEEQRFKTAAACFKYSKVFEDSPVVAQELAYIKTKGGFGVMMGDPERVLRKGKLPILKLGPNGWEDTNA